MSETLLVLCAVALLAGGSVLLPLVPAAWLVSGGAALTAAGLLLGVPTGLAYHLVLRARLAERGALPPRWWLRPVSLHERLQPGERPRVLGWFYAGGAGFLLSVAGCAAVAAGVVLEAFRAGVF